MLETLQTWLQFAIVSGVIVVAGYHLSRYGDVIAEKTGLSGSWVGLALLATVTSLPELVTGISSVAAAHETDIAVGDVLGSCVFNLLILALLDAVYRKGSLFAGGRKGHLLIAAYGILLLVMSAAGLLLAQAGRMPALAHIGLYAPAIVLVYLAAMRTAFRYEREDVAEFEATEAARYPGITLRRAGARYAVAAVAVVAAGSVLPFIAADLADLMGWSRSFVGTQFVAAVTSLPEIAVTFAALRMGAIDMAIANLLGSNLFNIAILAVDDAFYLNGPLLAHVSPVHAVTALAAIAMSAVVVIGLLTRPRKRIGGAMSWPGLALVAIYLLNSYALY
ncbi:MAG: sodium:calcium antiporter [Gammaproteobacteria bacterium]|nr:sodium:calcium antiporter [Gammaproteobacteria bacterium]